MKFLTRTITLLVVFNVVTGTIAVTPPRQKTLTISGSTGIAGVMMTGLPGNIVSDKNGYYIAFVPSGFTGTVKPIREGYTFEPASIEYVNVVSNKDSQNYIGEALTFIISGNAGVSDAVMKGLPGDVITDQRDRQGDVRLEWHRHANKTRVYLRTGKAQLLKSHERSD